MAFRIDAAVCSNMGKVRKNNEDNFFFNGLYMDENQRNSGAMYKQTNVDGSQLFAVCDGMGGEEGGEDASIAAVRGLQQYTRQETQWDQPQKLKDMLQSISDTIEDNANKKGFHSGTTIAMVVIQHDTLKTVHVGDSRVYCMEGGKLTRMTVDHSEVQRMYAMGLITAEEMDTHPKRHVISQFLGMPRDDAMVAPGISQGEPLKAGKRYLICSDGLTDMVKDPEIAQILGQAKTPEEAVQQLTAAALHHGGKDNVTTICLFVSAEKNKDNLLKKTRLIKNLSLGGMIASGALILAGVIMMLMDFLK